DTTRADQDKHAKLTALPSRVEAFTPLDPVEFCITPTTTLVTTTMPPSTTAPLMTRWFLIFWVTLLSMWTGPDPKLLPDTLLELEIPTIAPRE
uniref:hypothetical protein n=1 Tax=Nocardia seriolae TaxID=37332 RepID=UPI001E29AA1D